jgi:hypothetical protein
VHFTAVTEKFTPHDTVVSIASADELSDAALASACSLHTAVPSSCSSSGSSRRKLDEITEDAEEGQSNADTARPATGTSLKPVTTGASLAETRASDELQEQSAAPELPKAVPALGRPHTADEPVRSLSHSAVDVLSEKDLSDPRASDYRDSLKAYDELFKDGPAPRFSSQTARPAAADLYAEIYAKYNKPKVKLGPRPLQSVDLKRQHVSSPGVQDGSGPVSSLPAGMRIVNKRSAEPKRPKSRDSSAVPSIAFPPPPPVPALPEMPLIMPSRLSKSPASVRSMPIATYSGLNNKSSGTTPEKQRLMKALELRKKQMKAKQEREVREAEDASLDSTAGAEESNSSGATETVETPVEEEVETAIQPVEVLVSQDAVAHDSNSPPPTVDSGHDTTSNHTEIDDQHSAASASSPTTALTQGSSGAPSTRPSSISEDENVVPVHDLEEEKPADLSKEEHTSVESSPTLVPENDTAVPTVEISEAQREAETPPRVSIAEETSTTNSKRSSKIFIPATPQEGVLSERKNRRESMAYFSNETAPEHQSSLEVKEERSTPLFQTQVHSAEHSDAEYLSDDSFMEELQSAKFEQAKPVSVSASRSPVTPFFPRQNSVSEISIPERSTSQQLRPTSPLSVMERKASGPWLTHANTETVVAAKKINVSSGISERIKALAEKSNRDSSASVSSLATPDASASIVAQRKSSFFSTPSNSNGNSPTGKSVSRLSRASFGNLLNSTTPDKPFAPQPPPSREGRAVYNTKPDFEKPNSVQVTARIVRDGRAQNPASLTPDENTPLELHHSPITINHQKTSRPSSRPKSPTKPDPPKVEPMSPRHTSSAHSREQSASALPRSSSESSWKAFSRRRSESKSSAVTPRSQSAHSVDSTEEKREEKKEKKDSRTSKLLKRMSGFPSMSRKAHASNISLVEDNTPSTSLPSLREPPPAVQVGDLNVQFPDTLVCLSLSSFEYA